MMIAWYVTILAGASAIATFSIMQMNVSSSNYFFLVLLLPGVNAFRNHHYPTSITTTARTIFSKQGAKELFDNSNNNDNHFQTSRRRNRNNGIYYSNSRNNHYRNVATATTTTTTTTTKRKQDLYLKSTAASAATAANTAPVAKSFSDDGRWQAEQIGGHTKQQQLGKFQAALTKVGMLTFITSMCISLPISLLIPAILHKTRVITTTRKEKLSLYCGEFCARWSLRLFPFASLTVINKNVVATNNDNGSLDMGFDSNNNSNNFDAGNTGDDSNNKNTYKNNKRPIGNKIKSRNDNNNQQTSEPTVWVCNHQSMLDVFFLLASSNRLLSRMTAQGRGRRRRRPIKIIYWKQLEANPITRILFKMCGFISVDMDDNGNGNDNVYHVSSFRSMMKSAKKALLVDGFDLGILPEGQLNPTPEKGLLPIFSGAYTLSKMARCPIRMMGIHGSYKLWHPKEDIGMSVTERNVKVRMYPEGCQFCCAKEFEDTFEKVVGYFGAQGRDLPSDELRQWVDGTMWKNSMKLSAQIS